MPYTLRYIAQITSGKFLSEPASEAPVEQLLLDSRQVVFPATSLFFALSGPRRDGHAFIGDAYRKGVRLFVVSREVDLTLYPEASFLLVDDTLRALQRLAGHHRHRFDYPVVGITGSNGKTIVKEWLFQLLQDDYRIVRSPKSFNSQTGVPLSLWQMEPEHELGLFEAGISTVGEMAHLAPIVDCTYGLFTNIGSAHDEGFPSRRRKIEEKLLLFRHCRKLVCCLDQNEVAEAVTGAFPPSRLFTWARQGEADLQIAQVRPTDGGTQISARLHGQTIPPIRIAYSDQASIENAIHCWAVLLALGIAPDRIPERMARLEPVAMRLELKAGINGCKVINDSYNSDLHSLKIALDFLQQQSNGSGRTLILSDILQSGERPDRLYAQVAKLVHQHRLGQFIGIGNAISRIEPLLPEGIGRRFFADTDRFLEQFDPDWFQEQVVLVKGARPFQFERIANRLAVQAHKTVLEIDLNALRHNLNVYQRRLRPETGILVMVKASAYGSGAFEVAHLLEFQKVNYLGVAYADEGIALRKAGIGLPILVLNPEEASFDAILRYRLEPEIYSLRLLRQWLHALPPGRQEAPIHLKLETGMHRLGFEEGNLEELIALLQVSPQLSVRSIFSHLAASEDADHDKFSHLQARRFADMYERIAGALGYRPLRHLLNSSGIVRFPEYQMDLVRLGIGIYGIDSSRELQAELQPVLTLKATISQIKEVPAEETVGYGRQGQLSEPKRIAVISIGYADGLLRGAGNGRFSVLIRGRLAPIVGNVCMDMCMVDLSQTPDAAEGDEVIVFGKDQPVQLLADSLQTIPYEVFTNISGRVKRLYVQE